MSNTEVKKLHEAIRRQAEGSTDHVSFQKVTEQINRTQPPAFAEMVRRVNLDRELSPRLNRLILDSTIHLPAHLAAFIAKRSARPRLTRLCRYAPEPACGAVSVWPQMNTRISVWP